VDICIRDGFRGGQFKVRRVDTFPLPRTYTVPIYTVDDLVSLNHTVGILKVSCGGCEASALFGAQKLLTSLNRPCVILLEWKPRVIDRILGRKKAYFTRDKVAMLLVSSGYRFVRITWSTITRSYELHSLDPHAEGFWHYYDMDIVIVHESDRCFAASSSRWIRFVN